MRVTERLRGRDTGRRRSRFPAGSLMWNSIPGPWDHNLSQSQTLNHSPTQVSLFFFFKKKDVIYLFMKDTERERQRHRQKEKQVPCRVPDAGLYPRTLGSCPEPKADTQPLSHPGVPKARHF